MPSRERPITHAVIEWLDSTGWPLIFPEVSIPRGLIRGRVDVAAASKGFRDSVAIEVKAVHRDGDAEDQLFDAGRAAERVYLAAPPEVALMSNMPASFGILEARTDGAKIRLVVARPARRGKPINAIRREFLHALMRSAAQRGRFDPRWTVRKVCPACLSDRCPFWSRPVDTEVAY
ncbi:MAG: hypothetical protein L3K17_03740 [Thermoplasmata archaeon]|nr:hypothetical protein [Thermoplasmata archaeon]